MIGVDQLLYFISCVSMDYVSKDISKECLCKCLRIADFEIFCDPKLSQMKHCKNKISAKTLALKL